MSVIINPIITNAGLNVFTPMATGIEFTFTHVAVGTGTSAANANATALENEIDRFTIAGGGVIAGGKAVSINALVTNHSNANPQDYNISEIGFYGKDANNNTILFAIHRQNTTIVRKVAGADIALPFALGLSALPVENMTVTIDTNTSGALALLGQHVANAHPHTQYKRILDNTEQLKIANGTDNDHAVSKEQLDAAINTKANLGGSNSQRFKVANAVDNDEAVSKSQLDGAVSGIPPADLSGKADLAGSSTQTFSVATATANNHAVRKEQLDAKTGISTDTIAGIVEKATQAEMNAGTANVWPDAAILFNGFAQSADSFTLPEWMGGWRVHWGTTVLGDIIPLDDHTTFFSGFTSVSTVLVGSVNGGTLGAFTVHRKSFNSSSVTVIFDEWATSQIQTNAGYWWCAIGK